MGTSNPNAIEQTICNYNSTTFIFTPFLISPNLQAPTNPTNISYPAPSPTVPEFTIGLAFTALLMFTLIALVFKKRKRRPLKIAEKEGLEVFFVGFQCSVSGFKDK